MTKTKQLRIWSKLADITLDDEHDVASERCKHHTSLTESIAETIEFDKFRTSKLEILPPHLDREFKKQKGNPGLKEGGLPTPEKLVETLRRGCDLKSSLIQYEDIPVNDNSEEIIDALNSVHAKVTDQVPEIDRRHSSEFSTWLRSQQAKASFQERREIVDSEKVAERLHSNICNLKLISPKV